MEINLTTNTQLSANNKIQKSDKPTTSVVDNNDSKPLSDSEVKVLVTKGNEILKLTGRELSIQMDPELKKPVIQVIDQETKKVVRQFPSEEMLNLAKALEKSQGVLLSTVVK